VTYLQNFSWNTFKPSCVG